MNQISSDNGVQIVTDANGNQHFYIDNDKYENREQDTLQPSRGIWDRIKDWWSGLDISPYTKIRDLADPFHDRRDDCFDYDAGSDGKHCPEIGIKITF